MSYFGRKRIQPFANVFGAQEIPVELLGELPIEERGMQLVESVLAASGIVKDETLTRAEKALISNTAGSTSFAPDETVSRAESVVITNV
jgi:hypothetical protein